MRSIVAFVRMAIAIIIAAGVIVGASSLWFRDAVYGDRSAPAAPATFVVPRGATFADVTASLQNAGILAHPIAFRILARLRGNEADVQSGQFRFPAHQTSDEILRRLITSGTADALWVTFPEGFTAREIGQRLGARRLLSGDAFRALCAAHSARCRGGRAHPRSRAICFRVPTWFPSAARPNASRAS